MSALPDRWMHVTPKQRVETAWVDIWSCQLSNRDRMAVGDVAAKFQRRLALGDAQPWPAITGYWSVADQRFVILDGRHEWVAAVMLGHEKVLVSWIGEALA